jgi:predicted esterase
MADLYGFALVAPTFGAGNWDMPGGLDAVEAARQYCSTHPRMDPNRIYLAGLSNGGRGVCLGAGRSPEAYRGLIFISPVLEPDLMLTPAFLQQWHEKPILIIHGDNDNRIPLPYLLEAIQTLSSSGLHVESHILKDQTHFLFFSARDQVSALIGTWIRKD